MENNNSSRERQVFIDIESGENGSPGDLSSDPNPVADEKQGNGFLNNLASRDLRYHISATSGSDSDSDSNLDKASQDSEDSIQLLIDKNAGRQRVEQTPLLEKELPQGKSQSTNSKIMASKPPRPPRGPSLDASDLILVKEISEIVMKKRARKEHIKAFKRAKARAAKLSSAPSTSNNNTLCSLVITVVFLLILIFHGIPWKNSSTSILPDSSPGPSTGNNGLISVQVFSNVLPNHGIAPSSESPSSVEQSFGSGLTSPG